MTQEEKATRYDALVREADVVNRELSKLKSSNTGTNTTSNDYDNKLDKLNGKIAFLEAELKKLFV
jgi:chromosome segregation ATPase